MTSTMVSNVNAPAASQVQGAVKDTNKVAEEQDITFQNLLNSPKQSGKDASSLKSQMNAPTAKADAEKPFDAGSKRDAVKIDDGTKPKTLSKDEMDQVNAAVKEFSEKVEQVLEEDLDVSEEEIAEAMETLGLTFLDLSQTDQLIPLVAELTGTEETADLLMNQDLNGIMDQVSELVTNLTEETGIPMEELAALGMTETVEPLTEEFEAVLTAEQTTAGEAAVAPEEKEFAEELIKEEPSLTTRSDLRPEESKEPEAPVRVEENEPLTEPVRTETFAADQQQNAYESENTGTESGRAFTANSQTEQPEEHETFNHTATVQEGRPLEQVQEVTREPEAPRPVVDVQELLDQFTEFARTNITADTSSIEMRLNPENLGRLFINVQEHEGAVRATIQTQNAEVKEALETQIAVLRTSLEGQGLKVTEVEVTVASHEFEENLEQGNAATPDQEQGRERETEGNGDGRRRNLNVNDLDSLQGLMSEEEALAAQIMRDNGNSVDYTA